MCDTLAVTTLLLCACEKDDQHSLESKKNLSARLDSGIYTVYCEPKSVVVVFCCCCCRPKRHCRSISRHHHGGALFSLVIQHGPHFIQQIIHSKWFGKHEIHSRLFGMFTLLQTDVGSR